MSNQKQNCSEFSPLAVVVCFCFHPNGVSAGIKSECGPCGWVALTRSICIPGIRNFFNSPSTGHRGCQWYRDKAFGGSTYSTGPSSPCFSRAGGEDAPLLQIDTPLSQCGSLNRGESGSMEHILNSPLIGRDVHTRICCSLMRGSTWNNAGYFVRSCCSMEVYRVSAYIPEYQNLRATLSVSLP